MGIVVLVVMWGLISGHVCSYLHRNQARNDCLVNPEDLFRTAWTHFHSLYSCNSFPGNHDDQI